MEFQSPYPRVEFGPQSAKINLLCQFLSLYQPPTKMVPINDWMGNFTVPLPHRSLQTLLAQQRKKKLHNCSCFSFRPRTMFSVSYFFTLGLEKKVQTEFHSSNWVNIQHAPACMGEISMQKTTQRACRGNECLLVESARVWMVGNRAHLQTTL